MEDKNYTYDYFISYRRKSGGYEYAQKIRGILMKYGKKVFVDKNNLEIGKYPEQLANAIENSKAFILILNEDSWRQDTKIDVYYEEIIRIANTQRDILTIEYVSGTLKNIPKILSDKLPNENCKLSEFEKISVYQNPFYNFEAELCSKIGVAYQAIDPKLPKFEMSKLDSLIDREKIEELYESILQYRFSNLVGIGGSGKTSLTYRWAEIYGELFNNIALVTVNNNIKDDFVDSLDETLPVCKEVENVDVRYSRIIGELKSHYQVGSNLLVLDINEAEDKDFIYNFINRLFFVLPNNWKFLILSREKVKNDCHLIDLSDDVDTDFLKSLFQNKAGDRYRDFDEIDGLLETIHYSPLLAEQLGVFLKKQPKKKTLAEIKEILYADKFRNKERSGVSSYNRNEKETTIINFLNNLIDYEDFTTDEQNVLRHFVLWKSEYIQYDIIEDLLRDLCEDLEETLSNLYDRSILSFDETKSAYKLHGLLADSLREQIDVTKQDYYQFFDNVIRISEYDFRKFLPFADCIGNSLCEYEITKWVAFLHSTANKFKDIWRTDYAKRLYEKCIAISKMKLKTEPEVINCLEDLLYAYNNLAILQRNQLKDYKSVEINYNFAIEFNKRIIRISDSLKYQKYMAELYNNLAVLQANHNAPKSAAKNYHKAIKILMEITQQSDDPEYYYCLANSYYNLALLQDNDLDFAEENYNKAIDIWEQIRKTDNLKSEYLHLLSKIYNNLANIQKKKKDYEKAQESIDEAIRINDKIKNKKTVYLVDWMASKCILAEIYIAKDIPDAAKKIIKKIKPIAEDLLENFPKYNYLKKVKERIYTVEFTLMSYGSSARRNSWIPIINDWDKETFYEVDS